MSTQQTLPTTHSIPAETIGDRMRRALRKEHMGVQEMSEYLGVSRNTVGTWLNDHVKPSEQTIKLWAIRTGVPEQWLKKGVSPFPGGLTTTGGLDQSHHVTRGLHQPDDITCQLRRSWSITQHEWGLAA